MAGKIRTFLSLDDTIQTDYEVSFYMAEVIFPNGDKLYRNTIGMQTLDGVVGWVAVEHKKLNLKGDLLIVRQNRSLWMLMLSIPCKEDAVNAGYIFAKPKAYVEMLLEDRLEAK